MFFGFYSLIFLSSLLSILLIFYYFFIKVSKIYHKGDIKVINSVGGSFRELLNHIFKFLHDIVCKSGFMVLLSIVLTYCIYMHRENSESSKTTDKTTISEKSGDENGRN